MSEYIEKEVGIVSPVPVGAWSNATAYKVLNIVNNVGSTYIAKLANQGIEPGVASNWQTYWMLLAERGVGIQSTAIDEETGNLIITYTDGVVVDAGNVVPVEEFAELKHEMEEAISDAETATGSANDAATLAETKAGLADDAATLATEKAGLADDAATLANQKAQLASQAAELADTKAALADQKATLAQEAAEDAQAKAILAEDAATNANQAAEEARSIAPSKLDKQSYESTRKQAYTKDKDGQQSMTDLDTGSNAATIPVRDENGTFHVGTATQSTHPATKGYVDAQDALNEKVANKVTIIDNNSTDTQYPSAKAVNDKIKALPVPMQYKGTLGVGGTIQTLPEPAEDNEGFEYKVITDGTYAGQAAKVGDVFISNGTSWDLIPSGDEPSGTVTNVNIEGDGGIETEGSPITTSGTIKIKNTGVRGVSTGATNGTIKVDTNGTEAEVPVAGLQSGAFIDADTKVNKVSVPTETNQVYAKDASGTQKMINVPDITAEVEAEIEGIKEGTTIVGHSKVSDNLTPYSENSGTTQDNPFISQGTGTDNNSVIVTTGNIAKQLEKQGNTIVVNQRFGSTTSWTRTSNGVTVSFDATTGLLTVNGTATGIVQIYESSIVGRAVKGHRTWCSMRQVSGTQENANPRIMIAGNGNFSFNLNNTPRVLNYTETGSEQPSFQFFVNNGGVCNNLVLEIKCFDIESWNSAIITDLTSHPEHFSWYYNGSLAYDAGSLANCNGRYLECGQGRQLWDEQVVLNKALNQTGEATAYNGYFVSADYIRIVPNKPCFYHGPQSANRICFYDNNKQFISKIDLLTKDTSFTVPSNAVFMKFDMHLSTYENNITFSLYYTSAEGGEGYDQYYPYVAPIRIDTGNETLKAFDKKLPSGVIERNTGEVDLSTLTWTYNSTTGCHVATLSDYSFKSDVKAIASNYIYKGTVNGGSSDLNSDPVKTFALYYMAGRSDREIYIKDAEANTPTGVIQYELTDASKTTEQGTPYSEYADINDYSYMAWFDTDGNLVSIPQGCKLFYPVDYKGFTDDLVMYTNGDVTALAKKDYVGDAVSGKLNKVTTANKVYGTDGSGNQTTYDFANLTTDLDYVMED